MSLPVAIVGLLAALGLLATLLGPLGAHAAPLPIVTGPGVALQSFGVYGAQRDRVVAVTAPATFSAAVTIPPGARLLGAVAVPDRIWTTAVVATAAPLRFRVVFAGDGEELVLYERTIDIAAEVRDRRWFDFGRDLAPLAGRRGTLRFETTPAPGAARTAAAPTLGLWAPPEVLACSNDAPSLLLVTIDALRADHVSGAGYPRPTTPHLDAFAAGATRFRAAFAAGPKTIPSVPQILTGSYFTRYRDAPGLSSLLGPGRFETSRAIVNNPYVASWLGAERPGFQTLVAGDLDARAITSEALRFLAAAGRCRTALYLHYLDTHTPYRSPARYARRFIDSSAATTIGLTFDDVTGAWQGRYGAADRRRIADLYDGAIAWTDRQLGRLLRGLAHRGLLDRTIVIVTADHGEELWDHGQFFHGQSLYDELLHVPLLVRFPAIGHGREVGELASAVDLVPTIADAAGFPPPPADGVSLLPLAAGAAPVAAGSRTIFATVSHAEPRSPPRHAVRSATHKLIRNVEDGTLELYDLVADPRERTRLATSTPGTQALIAVLDAVRLRVADRGHHLRLTSTRAQPVTYVVTLAGEPAVPIVDLDRLTLERGDRVLVGTRAGSVTVRGTLDPGDEDEIRMDLLATTGHLRITATLDGVAAPPGSVRLGASAAIAGAAIDLADPTLIGPPEDAAERPPSAVTPEAPAALTADVTVHVWRTPDPAGGTAGAAPPLDPVTRERLRQLGYVD